MWDESKTANGLIRVCARCETMFVGYNKIQIQGCECPKCSFGHYGAPWVYGGFWTAVKMYIKQQLFKGILWSLKKVKRFLVLVKNIVIH